MDPVQQLFAQQSSGSAEGQGFGQFFAQGAQLNLQNRHLALQQKQEQRMQAQQNALLPLQANLLRFQTANAGIEAMANNNKLQAMTQLNSAMPEIYALESHFMSSKDGFKDPVGMAKFNELRKKYPLAFGPNAPGNNLWNQIQATTMYDLQVKRLTELQGTMKPGTHMTVQGQGSVYGPSATALPPSVRAAQYEAQLDEQIAALPPGSPDAQRLLDEKSLISARRRQIDDNTALRRQNLQLAIRKADQADDRLTAALLRDQLNALDKGYDISEAVNTIQQPSGATAPQSGEPPVPQVPATLDPGVTGSMMDKSVGLTPVVSPGVQPFKVVPRPLTTGSVTKLQDKIASNTQSLSVAGNALNTIRNNPEAIGVFGIGRGAVERAKGQLGVETDTKVSKARHQLGLDFTQLADGLRVDTGNMSLYERQKLELVGDATRWQESPQTAADMMSNIQSALIGRQLRLFKDAKRPPDDNLLRQIPSSEIIGLAQSGLITEDDALRWQKLNQKKK